MADSDVKHELRDAIAEMGLAGGAPGPMSDALAQLTEYLRTSATPDFVCVMAPIPPTPPTTFEGVEGVMEAWRDYGAAFADVRVELESVLESDSHLVVLVNQIVTTRHDGVEVTQPSAMVLELAGEQVKRLEFHLDQGAALRSAGLEAPS